ncbi:hypothetical protein M8J75_001225 [Diaphorina citri]|nr:hypothetical protein M8J75_001225 [Diaphorina citri]
MSSSEPKVSKKRICTSVRKKKDASQNDVLSQHQLDLIQQIMQQTAKAVVSSPSSQSPSSTSKTKTWTVQILGRPRYYSLPKKLFVIIVSSM